MMFHAVVVTVGILGICSGSAFAVDCSDKTSLENAQRQCFSEYSLDMGVSTAQLQNVIQNDPEAVCRNLQDYEKAMRCVLDISKSCLEQGGQSADILPDADSVINGMTYLCNHIQDIDAQCIQNNNGVMQKCAADKALAAFSGNSNLDVTTITCTAFKITGECMEEHLAGCSGQTKDVLVHFTQQYLTPRACQSGDKPGYDFTTVAPMTTFQLVTWVPMLSDVSCYSQSSIQAGQKKCFDQEGINVELPEIHVSSGQDTKQSYLDAMLSNNRDLHAVCRDLPRYQRALGCAMEVARHCMPSGYKNYLPDARNTQMMLTDMCNHVDELNQGCVTSKASALFDCGYKYGQQIRTRDVKTILCLAFKFNAKCQKEILPACGCKTTRTYVEISKKYLNPPACPAIEETVECHGNSDRFVDTGDAAQSVASVGLLAIAAVFTGMMVM